MKLPYEAPALRITVFRPGEPVAREPLDAELEENAASHDNGYVDPWAVDPNDDWANG